MFKIRCCCPAKSDRERGSLALVREPREAKGTEMDEKRFSDFDVQSALKAERSIWETGVQRGTVSEHEAQLIRNALLGVAFRLGVRGQ